MKKIQFLSFIILISISTFSQPYTDIASINYQLSPVNKFKKIGSDCTISDFNLSLKYPIVLKNENIIFTGLSGYRMIFETDTIFDNLKLNSIALQVGYIHKFNENNSLTFIAIPRFSSDFEKMMEKDFQIGFITFFTNKVNENLKLRYGIYYNQEFYGPLFVPLLGFDWSANTKLRFFGNLPITATAEYKYNNKIAFGLYFNSISATYLNSFTNCYLDKTTQEISLFNDFYITQNFVFQAKAGYSIGRSYNLYNFNDKLDTKISFLKINDSRKKLNTDVLNDGFLGEVKLIYRVNN